MSKTEASAIQKPNDFGPIYTETNMNGFLAEPWSTFSNIIFLLIVIYWSIKTKMNFRIHPLICVSLPILGVGFIGGVVYHATRCSRFWLLLDFMPILILVLAASIYLWQEIYKNLALTLISTLGPVFLYRGITVFVEFPDNVYISMGYIVLAVNILLPAILHCCLKNRRNWKWLALSALSFSVAITFRQIDMGIGKALPMGTHFLWHIFGGISAFLLIQYLYSSDREKIKAPDAEAKV